MEFQALVFGPSKNLEENHFGEEGAGYMQHESGHDYEYIRGKGL